MSEDTFENKAADLLFIYWWLIIPFTKFNIFDEINFVYCNGISVYMKVIKCMVFSGYSHTNIDSDMTIRIQLLIDWHNTHKILNVWFFILIKNKLFSNSIEYIFDICLFDIKLFRIYNKKGQFATWLKTNTLSRCNQN